jgi:glutathione S-transferase
MAYRLYGWRVSYFTAKLRCYLNYKKIPYEEKPMNVIDLYHTAKNKVGVSVMPILVTPQNEWLQDTKDIINEMERRFPERPVYPLTPCKRYVSQVIETWADEFWVPHAMHYRWNRPESVSFFQAEAARNLFPYGPRFLQNYASDKVKTTLVNYLPFVGVTPNQYAILEDWTVDMLTKLDSHFAIHPYLLGSSPSIGDFGLAGPLVAHLGRDTWPKEHLIPNTPHLQQWIERMDALSSPDLPQGSESDEIPPTLLPILAAISREFIPMMAQTILAVEPLSANPKFLTGSPLPRSLQEIHFPMHQSPYSRHATPFHLWKIQNIIDAVQSDSADNRRMLEAWLEEVKDQFDGKEILEMRFPRLDRVGVRVRFHQER